MTKLAALHALDVTSLDLPAFPPVTSVAEAVRAELDEWDQVLADGVAGPGPGPGLFVAVASPEHPRLRRTTRSRARRHWSGELHVPADGRVVAVVDWELAHPGDPMDDIAWLSLRATQEPFTDFPARLREYEELSGKPIDEDRVHYYQVMAETKLQVMGHRPDRGTEDDSDANRPPLAAAMSAMASSTPLLHRRLWLEALATATGPGPHTGRGAAGAGQRDHDWMYDAVLEQLRDVIVPRTSDPWPRPGARGSPESSSTWPRSTSMEPSTMRASSTTSKTCSAGAPSRCRRGAPRQPPPWPQEPSSTISTSGRCGTGSLARPNWPGLRWGPWPNDTGPTEVRMRP